jgi:putative membrane protein
MMFGTALPLLDVPAGSVPGWHLHAEAILPLILIEGIYLFVLARMHDRAPAARPVSENSVLLFTLGILAIYLVIATPLDDLADHYLLSAHMLQHLILSMVAPPLLLLGLPAWLLRPLLLRRVVFPIAYVLTRPLVAFALFNLTLVFVHLPGAMALELAHEHTIHLAAHALLISTGMLMWWPVLGSLPELPGLSFGLQLVYLFVQSFVPTVLSAFIIFTGTTIYPVYAALPRLWGLSALNDQQIGGLIMKLGGGAILWTVGTIIFFVWFAKEQRDEPAMPPPPPSLDWPDVEDELARMGLTDQRVR